MKVFITGATGYIGSAVALELDENGHEVLALARSDEAAETLGDEGYQVVRGDLRDTDLLKEYAEQADGIIHAGFEPSEEGGAVDAAAVEAYLEALTGTEKPLIYTSGVWVYGTTGNDPVDEEDALDPIPLVAWRVPVEERLVAAAPDVRTVVLRPALVYGRAGGIPAMLTFSAAEHNAVRFVGGGGNKWTMVHVGDLADLYRLALEAVATGTLEPGTVLNAAHDVPVTVREAAEAASYGAGTEGAVRSWPLEEAQQELGGVADALVLNQVVSGEKAKRLLEWRPEAPYDLLTDLRSGSYAHAAQQAAW
ncbi:MAG: NAD-dependent epimerase/dehydratase family protein [Rhodothermales bacterium]